MHVYFRYVLREKTWTYISCRHTAQRSTTSYCKRLLFSAHGATHSQKRQSTCTLPPPFLCSRRFTSGPSARALQPSQVRCYGYPWGGYPRSRTAHSSRITYTTFSTMPRRLDGVWKGSTDRDLFGQDSWNVVERKVGNKKI